MMLAIIFVVLMFIWVVNGVITLAVTEKVCERLLDLRDPWYLTELFSTRTVFEYHEPWRFSSWLGFRHYFYPFKSPTEK